MAPYSMDLRKRGQKRHHLEVVAKLYLLSLGCVLSLTRR
jgi:hypothetical protein